MRVINRHADQTGKKVMYAFNISDEMDLQMARIGALIDPYGSHSSPHFSVGSLGVETALTGLWNAEGITQKRTQWPKPAMLHPYS